jgi:hypothetical protein
VGNPELGGFSHAFRIHKGMSKKLTVFRNDLVRFSGSIGVSGMLVDADNVPLPHVRVQCSTHRRLFAEEKEFEAKTDDFGRFTLQGLKPGPWNVTCTLKGDRRHTFHNIRIPDTEEQPFSLLLRLPSGTLSALLVDAVSGLPIHNASGECWVHIISMDHRPSAVKLRLDSGNRLIASGVPPGRCTLYVHAMGYFGYNSKPIRVPEDGVLDLGRIPLKPSGFLDLKVTDRAGNPAGICRAYCNGICIGRRTQDQKRIADHHRLYWRLPTGEVKIRVEPYGCTPKEQFVNLLPGEPVELHMVVDRDD